MFAWFIRDSLFNVVALLKNASHIFFSLFQQLTNPGQEDDDTPQRASLQSHTKVLSLWTLICFLMTLLTILM